MEELKFDLLLREAAQQTSRRGALAALLGGVLVLNSPGESEANKKAKRRRDRKRRQYRQKVNDPFLRPIKVTVINPGPASVDLQFVGLDDQIFVWDCRVIGGTTLGAGQQMQYATTKPVTDGFAWINTTYAVKFRIYDKEFTLTRHADTSYKEFTLTLPMNL